MGRPDTGITNENSPLDSTTALTLTALTAIALYNVVELNFIIFCTFKKRGGLYFWSFFFATWGVALHALGFLIKGLRISSQSGLYVTTIVIGWSCMVTGQSVVLYSRLHLVDRNRVRLRCVLAMIIVDALICHIPIIVMIYGANSNNPEPWILPYTIYEKVQMTIFFIQECTISGLYIAATVKFFRLDASLYSKSAGQMMKHLILVNIVIIILDITVLGLEYAGYYNLQTACKSLAYSVKLKMEFKILNDLINLTKTRGVPKEFSGQVPDSINKGGNSAKTVRCGVSLDTCNNKGANSQTQRSNSFSTGSGYTAFVHRGSTGTGQATTNGLDDVIMVMTTTEVNVVHEGQSVDQVPDAARGSIDLGSPELRVRPSYLQ